MNADVRRRAGEYLDRVRWDRSGLIDALLLYGADAVAQAVEKERKNWADWRETSQQQAEEITRLKGALLKATLADVRDKQIADLRAEIARLRADWQTYLDTPGDVVRSLREAIARLKGELDPHARNCVCTDYGRDPRCSLVTDAMVQARRWYEGHNTDSQGLRDELGREMADAVAQAVKERDEQIESLKNDLLDALDLKAGRGPTALAMQAEEIARLRARVAGLDSMGGRWVQGRR